MPDTFFRRAHAYELVECWPLAFQREGSRVSTSCTTSK